MIELHCKAFDMVRMHIICSAVWFMVGAAGLCVVQAGFIVGQAG
jgi:hypothetical protein